MTTQPIGLSIDLAPQQVMRAIDGQYDMAVWRSTSGVVSAWENRCPHRGMRLSYGFVRGESLACAYHGWHYSCEGYCHYIPAHPELTPPKTVRPVLYSVVEQSGLIWVNTEQDAMPVALPDDLQPVRSLVIECDLATAVQALDTRQPHGGVESLSDTPKIITFETGGISQGAVVAIQQSQPNRLIVHMLVQSAVTAKDKIALSRLIESVRRQAESACNEAT